MRALDQTQALPEKTPAVNMRTAAASTLALLGLVSRAAASAAPCVELQGIVPDGGEGLLDLLFLLSPEKSLGNPLAPLDIFTNPLVPTVSDAPSLFPLSIYYSSSTTIHTAAAGCWAGFCLPFFISI